MLSGTWSASIGVSTRGQLMSLVCRQWQSSISSAAECDPRARSGGVSNPASRNNSIKVAIDQKLDVPMVPRRRKVPLHRSGDRQRKVLQIDVVWSGHDGGAAGFDEVAQGSGVVPWRVNVLDYFEADDDREPSMILDQSS